MKKYSSGLVSESFWFIEVKTIIKLINNGATWDEIKIKCLEENLLGLAKESRIKRVYGYLKNRISTLDSNLLQLFESSDLSTQKIINLIAIANQNILFCEFLYEVYREKCMFKAEELLSTDISIFFKNKQIQNEEIEKWNDVTLKRLRSAYLNFLTDAGLLTATGKSHILTPPILDIELEHYLEYSGYENLLKALKGMN